jgi:hypothetical protein
VTVRPWTSRFLTLPLNKDVSKFWKFWGPIRKRYPQIAVIALRPGDGADRTQRRRSGLTPSTRRFDTSIIAPRARGVTLDVGHWSRNLDLGQYEVAFRDNESDDEILPELTEIYETADKVSTDDDCAAGDRSGGGDAPVLRVK